MAELGPAGKHNLPAASLREPSIIYESPSKPRRAQLEAKLQSFFNIESAN
jgi:hypothetical protein